MTKKMYKKPQTEKVNLETEIRCEDMVVGSCGKSVEGKMGS